MFPKPLAKDGAKRANGEFAAVVICTMNRARQVTDAFKAASRDTGEFTLIVVDASADSETEKVVERFQELRPAVDVHYVRADVPGLAKQRNQAAAVSPEPGCQNYALHRR